MPPAIVTRHLTKLFASSPLTVAVTFGAQSTRGFFDKTTVLDDDGHGAVPRTATVLTLRTGSLTSVAQKSQLTVDGTVYEVRAVLPHEDGETTQYDLSVKT